MEVKFYLRILEEPLEIKHLKEEELKEASDDC